MSSLGFARDSISYVLIEGGKMRNVILLITVVAVIAVTAGCGRDYYKEAAGDTRVVARINDYEMTVSDFKGEVRPGMAKRYSKEDILDELITKQVLLQEAQRQNFDKNDLFMREIQRYWEQALLKLLFKKKSEELINSIRVDDSEVKAPETKKDVMKRKREKALEDWAADLKTKALLKIDKKLLDEIELK